FQLVEFSCADSKYREIENLFQQTMKDYSIHRLWRMCSPMLWQHFQLQKEHMEKKSLGQEVDERLLFHKMSPCHMPAIREQNFDWRICGTHGSMYGKGSCFARDVSYSHQYCLSSTDHHSMFVVQVLVGEFVQGNQVYLHPPTRPGISNRLLDNCVDNNNKKILVTFEKHWIYLAFILEY
ncbi:Poly [ADP-ribose] polymerase 12, partial [Mesitornis unicolor]